MEQKVAEAPFGSLWTDVLDLFDQHRVDPVGEIRQGDVVWIPPGQKHW